VSGKVTFGNKPLAGGGSIRFVPLDRSGKAAGGTIGESGEYSLSTYGADDGAIHGAHRVEIIQNVIIEPAVFPVPAEGSEPQDLQPTKAEVSVVEGDRIPESYGSSESPLRATVEDTDQNTFDFSLERTP